MAGDVGTVVPLSTGRREVEFTTLEGKTAAVITVDYKFVPLGNVVHMRATDATLIHTGRLFV